MLTYAFKKKSSKVEVEGIGEVEVQRMENGIEWGIILKIIGCCFPSRRCIYPGQAAIKPVQGEGRMKMEVEAGNGCNQMKLALGISNLPWE